MLAASVLVVACGSSGGGGAAGAGGGGGSGGGSCHATGPGSTPGSMMAWAVDGTADCAELVSSSRSTKNGFDTITVIGTNTKNHAVNLKVTIPGGALEAKAYACDAVYDLLIYSAGPMTGVATTYPAASCTITLTSLGSATTPATGTFSAVLEGDAAPHEVTDGTFTVVPKMLN
jgi:hypothetical protein